MQKTSKLDVVKIPVGYHPSLEEEFMNDKQMAYFRLKLLQWKQEILSTTSETIHHLQEENKKESDVTDRASSETDRALELRARDRERKLLNKIDAALKRIEEGSYGYCVETGEPISLRRLEARPIATLSIEAQEKHEKLERIFKEEEA